MPRRRKVTLSNIREHLGWLVGRTVVDVIAGDPPAVPDSDPSDEWDVSVMLDNGGYVTFSGRTGFHYYKPTPRRKRKQPTTRKRKGGKR